MSTPQWLGLLQAFIEQPDSFQYNRGEKSTLTRIFRGRFDELLAGMPWRGQWGSAGAEGYTVVDASVTRERGGIGKLTINYEILGDDNITPLPPDEVSCDLEKIERALREHPRYAPLTEDHKTAITTLLSTAEDNPSHPAAEKAIFGGGTNPVGIPVPLAIELYKKEKNLFTHFAMYPPNVKRVRYYWSLPANLSAGGYRENLPPLGFTPPTTILGQPIEWIREGDRFSYNGTHYIVTSSWLGGIALDRDIYP